MNFITFNEVKFKCPVCEHLNEYNRFNAPVGVDYEFVYCDDESGGCGCKIMLTSVVTAHIKVTAHKIPGKNYSKPTIQLPYEATAGKEVPAHA